MQPDQSTRTVNVVGQVNKPGVYNFKGGQITVGGQLTVLQTLAGGFTPRAEKKAVEITSRSGEKATIDLDAMMHGSVPNVWLKAGDVVRIPELSK
jgi:protein involved in polysaccharide export with SLBB domain